MRDGIAFAHRVNPFSALTSEFGRATNAGETRHFTTSLNSDDRAALLPGTRLAQVESMDVLGYAANGSLILTLPRRIK